MSDIHFTYGDHVYEVNGGFNFGGMDRNGDGVVDNSPYRDKATATVTFTHVPADFAEFEAVYNVLGKSIAGTVGMIPMALEMYARDMSEGQRCFNLLCNSAVTVSSILSIVKTKIIASPYAPANDPYIQRYLAAALLKGATPANAYCPVEPYTVEMCASVNTPRTTFGGMDYFIYIIARGWDTIQRQVEILQPTGSEYFKVYNCPSCYTQCKIIQGTWGGLK